MVVLPECVDGRPEESIRSPGTRVIASRESPRGCWELVLLTAQSFLQGSSRQVFDRWGADNNFHEIWGHWNHPGVSCEVTNKPFTDLFLSVVMFQP